MVFGDTRVGRTDPQLTCRALPRSWRFLDIRKQIKSHLSANDLTFLPQDVFKGLTSLERL